MWKSQSPTLYVSLKGYLVTAIVDEGSEISAIDASTVDALNIPLSRTIESAQTAGSLSLNISGKTAQDIIVCKILDNSRVYWNLGQCLVIENLGCDVLIGEPAKAKNNIQTNPMSKLIYAYDDLENKVVLSYENISPTNLSDRSVFKDNNEGLKSVATAVKVKGVHTLYPYSALYVDIPQNIRNCSEVLVETDEIRNVKNGKVCIENSTSQCQGIEDKVLFFTPVSSKPKSALSKEFMLDKQSNVQRNHNTRKIYDVNREQMRQFIFPHQSDITNHQHLEKVQIDPDNRLSPEYKTRFQRLIASYHDIITEVPGRYNGYYGQVSCAMSLSDTPPPSIKLKLPNYSDEKLQILASLMDDMEK